MNESTTYAHGLLDGLDIPRNGPFEALSIGDRVSILEARYSAARFALDLNRSDVTTLQERLKSIAELMEDEGIGRGDWCDAPTVRDAITEIRLLRRLLLAAYTSLPDWSRAADRPAWWVAIRGVLGIVDPKPRCAKCGWPLAQSVETGCVAGNCSERKP